MKVHLRTFGCRANHYDTEAVRQLAQQAGHTIVEDASKADLAVFNSCAVTAEAERDVRKAVRRAARENPQLRSVVMGCASALPASQAALKALPTVQTLVSGADMGALAAILGETQPITPQPAFAPAALYRQSSVRANLRIQDGCDEHCTFCATTIARGANRSRGVEELVREAEALAEHHPEIVITGTHIGAYGTDVLLSLGRLMQELVTRVPAVRFRLSSIEATEVDGALAELLRDESGRVAPHLHAPLQSGSDRLLKRMGRHWYTAESYVDAIERLVASRPVFGLGADIIVGFPGETPDDFALTEAVVQQLPFTYLHVFSYSPRAGTAATRLPDAVPLSEAHERSQRLRHLAQEKARAYRESRAGGRADVVVIGSGEEREGLTEDFLTVRVPEPRPRGDRFAACLRWDGNGLTCHSERSEETRVGAEGAAPSSAGDSIARQSAVGAADPSALRASG